MANMNLSDQIELLLGDFKHLSPRLRQINIDSRNCGERINVRCNYITFRDKLVTFDEFINVVSDHIVSFCIPRSEIRAAQETIKNGDIVKAGVIMSGLSQKARELFIKAKKGSHRSGEAGEIVLYILNEWQLRAPQVVSKMYLKTNNNMPVHGTDGIHARFHADKLFMYWGESKVHKELSSALSEALDSIKEFIKDAHEKREIEIVSSFADFDQMDKETRSAILKYLDPYEEKYNERVTVYSCLLIYQWDKFEVVDDIENKYIEGIKNKVKNFVESIKKNLKNKELDAQRFEFFLLSVPSVQDFRDKFQKKIGWPND